MVDDQQDRSKDDLTEEASNERLRHMRQSGLVVQSYELSSVFVLLTTVLTAYLVIFRMGSELIDFMKEAFSSGMELNSHLDATHQLRSFLGSALKLMIGIGLPVCISGFLIGSVASACQIGLFFNMDRVVPKLDNVNPIKGLRKILSIQTLGDVAILSAKILAAFVTFSVLMKDEILNLSLQINEDLMIGVFRLGHIIQKLCISIGGVFVVFAMFDLFIKKWSYLKNARTTKHEALQESREREGDPRIKVRMSKMREK